MRNAMVSRTHLGNRQITPITEQVWFTNDIGVHTGFIIANVTCNSDIRQVIAG